MEHIICLGFKLRIFGIPIHGEARVLNDNNIVVGIISKLVSTLNKKNSSIAYHLVICNVAAGMVRIGWVEGISNISYALMNRIAAARRSRLLGDCTYLNRITSQG